MLGSACLCSWFSFSACCSAGIELKSLCMLGRCCTPGLIFFTPTVVFFFFLSSYFLLNRFPQMPHCRASESFTLVWILTEPLALDALGWVSTSFDLLWQIEVYGPFSRGCWEGLPELSSAPWQLQRVSWLTNCAPLGLQLWFICVCECVSAEENCFLSDEKPVKNVW